MSIPVFVNKKILVNLLKDEGLNVSYTSVYRWEKKGIIKPDGVKREGGGSSSGIYILSNVLPQIRNYLKTNNRARNILSSKSKV